MKNVFVCLLFLTFCVVGVIDVNARTEEEAGMIAEKFFHSVTKTDAPMKSAMAESGRRIAAQSDAKKSFYVFSPEGERGFVIISGEDALSPIVGYSLNTDFDMAKAPDALLDFLKAYSDYADAVASGTVEAPQRIAAQGGAVAPLLTTHWNQGEPYWNDCPLEGDANTFTGCVATAMAQVMKFYNYPSVGMGTVSNTTTGKSIDLTQSAYDWDNMLDDYVYAYVDEVPVPQWSDTEAAAVARLMLDCGYAVDMEYSAAASGAITSVVGSALVNNFGYSPEIMYLPRSAYNSYTWLKMVRENLQDGMPLVYSGKGDLGGHAFVCDGIDENNYLHINWGWSGYCDGYFDFDALAAVDGDTVVGDFSLSQAAIFNIRPAEVGESAQYWSLPVLSESVSISTVISNPFVQAVKVKTPKIENCTGKTISGSLGYCVYQNDEMVYSKELNAVEMPAGTYYSNITWTINISSISTYGDMEIMFAWKDADGNWSHLPAGDNVATIKVSRTLYGAEFSLPDALQSPLLASAIELQNEKSFVGYENTAYVDVRNLNSEAVETTVRLVLVPAEDYSSAISLSDYPSTDARSIALEASQSVSLSFPIDIAESGDYVLLLDADDCEVDFTPLAMTVGVVAYPSVSDVQFAAAEVEAGDDIDVSFTLLSEADYEGYVRLSLISESVESEPLQSARRVASQDATADDSLIAVSLVAGTPKTISTTLTVADDFVPGTSSLQIQFSNPADGSMVDDPNAGDYADAVDLVVKEQVYTAPVGVAALAYLENSFRRGVQNKVYVTVYAEDGLEGEMLAYCECEGEQVIIGEVVNVSLIKKETAEIELPLTVSDTAKNGIYMMTIKYRTSDSDEYQPLSLGEYEEVAQFTIDALQTGVAELFADSESLSIYSIDGVCVLRNATVADLKNLPKGVYIVNGKKIMLR